MSNLSRRLVMAAAAAGAALALASCNQGGGAGGASADAMTMGDPKAPVHVEEYASLTCGHCGQFALEVLPAFKAKYIDTGKARYTLHEFPTPPIAVAAAGFLTARCAGKDKYFGVVDAIFHSQQEMFTSGDPRGVLLKVAQSAGMTEQQFNACIQDEKALEALNARVEQSARRQNITSTPTFVINGKVAKEGAMTLEELDAAIAAASK
ncbi:DsbA family protein [Phenylobacterium sp.]|uniref:DsbA family protein n=1 Tax=Phenylobacterium sp. TaxID=1871053 RepID=UPI00301C789B